MSSSSNLNITIKGMDEFEEGLLSIKDTFTTFCPNCEDQDVSSPMERHTDEKKKVFHFNCSTCGLQYSSHIVLPQKDYLLELK